MTPAAPPPRLVAFLIVLAILRVTELALSARHVRVLAARGAREFGRGHFPLVVIVHALYPVALWLEVTGLGARPGPAWPLWLAAWLASLALKTWTIRTLGVFWNVRVWVVPGAAPIRSGPYRFLTHPNYLAVALELVAGPMMFGAWRTALAFLALHAVVMAFRIPVEERALAWGAGAARAQDAQGAG